LIKAKSYRKGSSYCPGEACSRKASTALRLDHELTHLATKRPPAGDVAELDAGDAYRALPLLMERTQELQALFQANPKLLKPDSSMARLQWLCQHWLCQHWLCQHWLCQQRLDQGISGWPASAPGSHGL